MKSFMLLFIAAWLLSGCGKDQNEEPAEAQVRSVKITTAVSVAQDIEVSETALGRIIDPVAATIGAEVPGRVESVLVDAGVAVSKGQLLAVLDDADAKSAVAKAEAELKRLQAQQQAQRSLVNRYQDMIEKNFISKTVLEQAQAQLDVLQQGEQAAEAGLNQARNNLQRTRIISPVAGRVEQRLIAAGDYIGLGKPMFSIAAGKRLIVSIPLPETRAAHIEKGQMVRLHLAGATKPITAPITDLTPMVGRSNAFEARVEIDNPGHWRPGASVTAEIITDHHNGAVMVPEECVVLRPAGSVVYRITGNIAHAVPVTTGVHSDGRIELISGLAAGEVIAAEGAAYLSDGAQVEVHNTDGVKP